MTTKTIVKTMKSAESTISVILGILVVVVIGILLYNYFKNFSKNSSTLNNQLENEAKEDGKITSLPKSYKVASGETLWSISEKLYGSGYNWVDLSKANNLKDPGTILVDQELTVPNVPVRKPIEVATSTKSTEGLAITGNRYTVVKGDNLWNISVRAYQDGFKWTEVLKANNNISNPNLIYPGTILVLPR